MPKSKRQKVVALTKTKKKGREAKEEMIEQLHACVGKYANIFVMSFENMRTGPLKKIQGQMRDSKFFIGKNKVMQVALGKNPEDECEDNTHVLS